MLVGAPAHLVQLTTEALSEPPRLRSMTHSSVSLSAKPGPNLCRIALARVPAPIEAAPAPAALPGRPGDTLPDDDLGLGLEDLDSEHLLPLDDWNAGAESGSEHTAHELPDSSGPALKLDLQGMSSSASYPSLRTQVDGGPMTPAGKVGSIWLVLPVLALTGAAGFALFASASM